MYLPFASVVVVRVPDSDTTITTASAIGRPTRSVTWPVIVPVVSSWAAAGTREKARNTRTSRQVENDFMGGALPWTTCANTRRVRSYGQRPQLISPATEGVSKTTSAQRLAGARPRGTRRPEARGCSRTTPDRLGSNCRARVSLLRWRRGVGAGENSYS